MRFGTFDAVAHFNIGRKSTILIYEKLGMIPGRYTSKQFQTFNQKRLYFGKYKSSDKERTRRKVLRGGQEIQN